jgi:hypothetical protein
MIEFDLNGRKLALDEAVVGELQGRALAGAVLGETRAEEAHRLPG